MGTDRDTMTARQRIDMHVNLQEPDRVYTVPYSQMEKNFKALLEKGYSRDPAYYERDSWILKKARTEEMVEVKQAMMAFNHNPCKATFMKAIEEISDVQNLMDYLAEFVTRVYIDGLIERAAINGLENVLNKRSIPDGSGSPR